MAKYSEEFKIKLVTEYLYGKLGYKSLTKKYNMGSETSIIEWVKVYNYQGINGLKRRKTREEYPVQFKYKCQDKHVHFRLYKNVQFMLQTGASFLETAVQFNLNNPSLIRRWMKEFKEQGVEGLKPRPKRRPSMSKKIHKQKKKEEKKLTREEELKRENELLRLENAYLKKLRAFRENSNAFHEKHKQRWHYPPILKIS